MVVGVLPVAAMARQAVLLAGRCGGWVREENMHFVFVVHTRAAVLHATSALKHNQYAMDLTC
jgi:hypothetical protein